MKITPFLRIGFMDDYYSRNPTDSVWCIWAKWTKTNHTRKSKKRFFNQYYFWLKRSDPVQHMEFWHSHFFFLFFCRNCVITTWNGQQLFYSISVLSLLINNYPLVLYEVQNLEGIFGRNKMQIKRWQSVRYRVQKFLIYFYPKLNTSNAI
jgi:hypothetical protein